MGFKHLTILFSSLYRYTWWHSLSVLWSASPLSYSWISTVWEPNNINIYHRQKYLMPLNQQELKFLSQVLKHAWQWIQSRLYNNIFKEICSPTHRPQVCSSLVLSSEVLQTSPRSFYKIPSFLDFPFSCLHFYRLGFFSIK